MAARDVYDKASASIGKAYGQACSVYRPPADKTVNQVPTLIYTGYYKVEKSNNRLAQSLAAGLEHYTIFGKRSVLQRGDLIIPTGTHTTTPIITVTDYSPLEECVGVKTNRIGEIRNGQDVVYTGFYFDYIMDSNYPGQPLNRELKDSLGLPSIRAVMFNRTLHTITVDQEGLFIYDLSSFPNVSFQVIQIVQNQALSIMDLRRGTLA